MALNPRDAMLQSIKAATTVTANGLNYGTDINRGSLGRITRNKVVAQFRVTTAFAAGNFTLLVCSGSTATPTTIVASGPLIARDVAIGTMFEIPIPAGALSKYTRLAVNNATLSATGVMEGELVVTPYGS